MIKILSVSFALSVATFLLIIASPVVVSEGGKRLGPSPYAERIDDLYESMKGADISPYSQEWQELKELNQKNNDWFEERSREQNSAPSLDYFGVLQEISSAITFILIVVWGGGFLLTYRILDEHWSLLVLVFPSLMFALRILSFQAFISIVLSVLVVYSIKTLRKRGGA
ncbi:hypothetical protein A6779_12040 [Marinobacter adhaerens]|uniref:hypothetical protein n=1 Tax=Marinobacter adhaerens TaxID=1033846 RepID=UPI000840A417|nr:hypothetical protein [Marinobacter adhaerens]ODM29850.1 hypothetical protein A6779_12040 [Marinobacter adhaerens]